MSKKLLLADIANELGVSKTLVSLVMNNKADEHGISPGDTATGTRQAPRR
jgi:DNA-binding LacI/PurR family transcriptional regulator